MNGKVTVNATVVLTDNPHTRSLVVKKDIQKKLIEVIQVSFGFHFLTGQFWQTSNRHFRRGTTISETEGCSSTDRSIRSQVESRGISPI
jgi:hypothetical protein